MSQEPGLFSVRRPRETLGAVSHNASAIPMPTSAMKRSTSQSNMQQAPHTTNHVRTTSASRMSLAPGRPAQPNFQRSNSGDNLAGMGFSTVRRNSTMNFMNSTGGGRKSFAPVATPAPSTQQQMQDSTQRRSSVYSARPSAGFGPAGHQSFFATAPPLNGIPTDPRRLRDRETKTQMGQELMDFLTQRNFEMDMKHSLTHKTMTSPTQRDFDSMFQFIYHFIDPSYRFRETSDKEVPPLLKQMRYPFEKNISKSQLSAVGGNNWSTFLGLLHWMMNLAKMMEAYSTGVYDDACIEAGFDVSADRITFQFLSDAYKEWLSIEDDDDDDEEAKRRIQPHVDAMAAKFQQANEANLEQVKQLESDAKELQDQLDELEKSAPRLAKLDETFKILEEDRVKFENYNSQMEAKVEKYLNRASVIQNEIRKCEQELRESEQERDELQRRVDDQGLAMQDIDRMNSERERLQKAAETTSVRLDETKERMLKKEAETSAKLDELEATVQRYNGMGYQAGIIPATAQNAYGFEHELHLNINEGPNFSNSQLGSSSANRMEADRLLADSQNGYQPYQILQQDLKLAKKALQDLRKEVSERRNTAMEEDMAKMDMLDKTKEALDDKYAEMDTLGHRMRAAQEEFEKTKEITNAQNMASDAQIERMEKELAKMRAGLTESVQLMEQREMSTNLEYEQLTLKSSSIREELHTELERMLNDIIKFKIHVQQSLEAYEEVVAEEVENEWKEQEAAEAEEKHLDEMEE
ncbi:Putative kinetochore protein ndc80 [Acrodontium crateriforme]|uniref:Kinetochore protein NDC80 n=1 Tax=Acrodontium crateriforme TaxID=150365 RepID=A0AAQ3R6C9_9PEZI|nr:Putative kinetochore protein ndc80 [Acrodontium crateriforme]